MRGKYSGSDKMSDVIADNFKLLQVLSRFGITLGFAGKSIDEVCHDSGVDVRTFLSVLNYASDGSVDVANISVGHLLSFLRNGHSYFLEYMLPEIRMKLLATIDCSSRNEVAFLILKFFDEYVSEVSAHMEYEEKNVFAYVDRLLGGDTDCKFRIGEFARQHASSDNESMDGKLDELKNIFVRYCPRTDNMNRLNSVLYDIFSIEEDLSFHCLIEDNLFVPSVELLEEMVVQNVQAEHDDSLVGVSETEISDREREIIRNVAKGYINKEIADILHISVNTVTTHRRNISKKLGIHTPAGLTIYAIANKLIDIEDVKM